MGRTFRGTRHPEKLKRKASYICYFTGTLYHSNQNTEMQALLPGSSMVVVLPEITLDSPIWYFTLLCKLSFLTWLHKCSNRFFCRKLYTCTSEFEYLFKESTQNTATPNVVQFHPAMALP